MSDPAESPRRAAILAIGDFAALLVFTLIGLANHKDGITAATVSKVMGPFVVVGAVVTAIVGTYRRPSIRTLIPAWLVTIPVAILMRKALFHTPVTWSSTVVFIGVALAFSLLFILAWRLVARAATRSVERAR